MKAKVLVDGKGEVIAAVIAGRRPPDAESNAPEPGVGPLADEGQEVLEIGLSDEFEHQPLEAVMSRVAEEIKVRQKSRK